MTWRRALIGPSNLCRPIGVFPQIWWSREALSSGTHSENVLLSSWKLNRILQKHIQKLVYICGRANLSSNSLFGFVFIDLRTFENSASLSEGLRQPSHYSWIGRRQCCLAPPSGALIVKWFRDPVRPSQHLGLSVSNGSEPFNNDQTRPD